MTRTIGLSTRWLFLFAGALLSLAPVTCGGEVSSEDSLASLGPEEEEDLRTVYLRDASVVLSPGTWDFEMDLQYRRGKTAYFLSESDLTRQIQLALTARSGIRKGLEGLIYVPMIYSYREVSESGTVSSAADTGLGDVSTGVSLQITPETASWPELLGTIQVRAPTGQSPYQDDGNRPTMGSGHWALAANLQWVRSADPLVLFGGIGYFHQFPRDASGQEYAPGPGLQYSMGLGFSVNTDVSLSGRFVGFFQSNWKIDGETVEGSSYEPMTLRLAATMRCRRKTYLEPAVTFGLNDDAPDVSIGAALVMRIP